MFDFFFPRSLITRLVFFFKISLQPDRPRRGEGGNLISVTLKRRDNIIEAVIAEVGVGIAITWDSVLY